MPDQDNESGTGGDESTHEDALEPFRHVPVGTNDPNIVGDAGPFDTPPGHDPESTEIEEILEGDDQGDLE